MINFHPVDFLLKALEAKGEAPGSVKAPAAVAPAPPTSALAGRPMRPRGTQPHIVDAAAGRSAPPQRDSDAASDTAASRIDSRGQSIAARPASSTLPAAANVDPVIENAALSLRLSTVAQLLGDVAAAGNDPAPAISPPAPLLPQPPLQAAELAVALQRSIADSGLFYESHLAQWALQQYPQQQLQAEPQAQWHQTSPATGSATADATTTITASQPNASALALPDHAVPLLWLQLQALITQQIAWQGEPWPGQSASIRIADESPSPHEGVEKTWHTRIDLILPVLGAVNATIGLTGQRLDLMLQSATGESAERLRTAAQSLVVALNARAFDIATVRIEHGDAS